MSLKITWKGITFICNRVLSESLSLLSPAKTLYVQNYFKICRTRGDIFAEGKGRK